MLTYQMGGDNTCADVAFALPEGWALARESINLNYTPSSTAAGGSSYLDWKEFLLSQLGFAGAVELP